MASFLDRVVARAKGRGAPVQPRFAHRFAQPDHHLAPAAGTGFGGLGSARADDREDDHADDRAARDTPGAPEPAGDGGASNAAEARAATPPPFERALERPQIRSEREGDVTADARGAAAEPRRLPVVERARDARDGLPGTPAPAPRPDLISNTTPAGARPSPERALVLRTPPPGDPVTGPVSSTLARGAADPAGAGGGSGSAPGRGRLARAAAEDAFWKFLYGTSTDDGSAPSLPPLGGPRGGAELAGAGTQPGLAAGAPGAGGVRAAEAPSAEITISIDRIDVRGLAPPAAPARAAVPARRTPRMSLTDYMSAQKPGGSRR